MIRFLRAEAAQATVELALAFAIVLLPLAMGFIEMGFLMSQALNLNAAVREGARMAGAQSNGGGPLGCGTGQSPNWTNVDPQVIAAIERALTANGSLINLADVTQIRIAKATSTGAETSGYVNVWVYSLNGGPTIDGQALDFVEQSRQWDACSRLNTLPSDSARIQVRYTYRARTPFRYFFSGLATINLTDEAVMTMNATQ